MNEFYSENKTLKAVRVFFNGQPTNELELQEMRVDGKYRSLAVVTRSMAVAILGLTIPVVKMHLDRF